MHSARVFVYGSLKRGFRHHDVLRGASFDKQARIRGFCLRWVGEYPAMVPDQHGTVRGEVYVVSREQLARLDEFEDCPKLYQREAVHLDDGSTAFAYTMSDRATRGAPRVDGEWWQER